ncbi:hypothetical protein F5051DRAFT_434410, partial [Lentinula edodes]
VGYETVTVEDPALDFTLPGYDIELKAFAVEELMKLFGNGDEDYTVESETSSHGIILSAISTALEADHGFNPESRAIWNLLEIMAEYDANVKNDWEDDSRGASNEQVLTKTPSVIASLNFFISAFTLYPSCSETPCVGGGPSRGGMLYEDGVGGPRGTVHIHRRKLNLVVRESFCQS